MRKIETEADLLIMKLHEEGIADGGIRILCVLGGWIYKEVDHGFGHRAPVTGMVFIPRGPTPVELVNTQR